MDAAMDGVRDVVVIGVDPHKRSVTIEARDAREVLRATGSFPTTTAGYRAMLRYCRQWPTRLWAIEGAGGVGRPLAQRLLADAERVVDVPAKLSARVRRIWWYCGCSPTGATSCPGPAPRD